MIELNEARTIIEDEIVFERSYPSKKRVSYVTDFCRKVMLQEDQRSIIIRFYNKENKEQQEEILRLYNPMTLLAVNPILSVFRKAYNSDNIRKSIEGSKNDVAAIEEATEHFYEGSNPDVYLEEHLLDMESIDPNGFLMTNRKDERDQLNIIKKLETFPFRIHSHQIRSYKKEKGEFVWLIAEVKKMERVEEVKGGKVKLGVEKPVSQFVFYSAGIVVVYQEYHNKTNVKSLGNSLNKGFIELPIKDGGKKKFFVESFKTSSQEFPMRQNSNVRDLKDSEVRVPPYWKSEKVLIDLINLKAREDLTLFKHVYPRVYQYAPKCGHRDHEGRTCMDGFMNGNPSLKCRVCDGLGAKIIRTPQDTIIIEIPDVDSVNEMVKLSDMIYTHEPKIDLPKYLDEKVDKARGLAYFAVFNTELTQKAQDPRIETATRVLQEEGSKNSVVWKHAQNNAEHWKKIMRLTAQYLEVKKVEISKAFTRDLKLESAATLIQKIDAMNKANLGEEFIFPVKCDLLQKINSDNPDIVQNVKAWAMHRPFEGKTPDEIKEIRAVRKNTDPQIVKYDNWHEIKVMVNESKPKTTAFWEIAFSARELLISKAVKKIVATIEFQEDGDLDSQLQKMILGASSIEENEPKEIEEPEQVEE